MTDETRDLVAHLFRRAGFGARRSDLDAYATKGYAVAVDDLLRGQSARNPKPPLVPTLLKVKTLQNTDVSKLLGGSAPLVDAQTAWVKQMVTTDSVMVERMTLFLSNHFATAFTPFEHIDVGAMTAQQAKIRRYALGSFKELAHSMIDDMALAVYLNNDDNATAVPNENLARELMELFILGAGNYTEADVKEVARALTGYALTHDITGYKLTYSAARHDAGLKTILGTQSAFTPHSVVDLLFTRPAASRFLATKLVTHFVSPKPDAALVSSVAQSLAGNWNLADAMRVIFLSAPFKAAATRQVLVKSPAEYVVGAMRALGRTEYAEGAAFITAAGQPLYQPPTVAGWPQGQSLLGAGAMLARYNAAATLASFHMSKPAAAAPSGPDLLTWVEGFGMTSLAQPTVDALTAYANATTTQSTQARVGGLITLLASSPDFNLA